MSFKNVLCCLLLLQLLPACQPKSKERESRTVGTIPFREALNYFVRNDFDPATLTNPKIETQEAFERIFGMAVTMGPEGKPTPIDFTKQVAIAVIREKTTKSEQVVPVSLARSDGAGVTFSYRIIPGEEQSFSIVPFALIIANKTEASGKVALQEED